jgi:UDP-glucuronate 4-epimerase
MTHMTTLVTGTAGFIGSFVGLRLLESGEPVVGLDNLNPYYDVSLKEARLARLKRFANFTEARIDLADRGAVAEVFRRHRPKVVIHLAAQAGVRYSIEAPQTYVDANLVGLGNILEGCRETACRHLLFASSSSVYGTNAKLPFAVDDPVDHPISLYAATKRAGELMVHTYAHLFNIPSTCLRFFTVYGPWGRPDMALFLFTEAIQAGRPIRVFNKGEMRRAFTYVDDIVECVLRLIDVIPMPIPGGSPATSSSAPFRVLNLGSEETVELERYIELIEKGLGKKAIKEYLPMQPGDVPVTWADASDLKALIDWRPTTSVETGVQAFTDWYKEYYGIDRPKSAAAGG